MAGDEDLRGVGGIGTGEGCRGMRIYEEKEGKELGKDGGG